jgi:hypothetical protein
MGRDDEEWIEVRRRGRKKHRQDDDVTDLARQKSRFRRNEIPVPSRFGSSVSHNRFDPFSFHRFPGPRFRYHSQDRRSKDEPYNMQRFNHATRAGYYHEAVPPRSRFHSPGHAAPAWQRFGEARRGSPTGHQHRRFGYESVQDHAVKENHAFPSYGVRRDDHNLDRKENTSS